MELTYREENGVLLPNLVMPDQPEEEVTKYGTMRLNYLKNKRKGLYTNLLTSGQLTEHLLEMQHEAQDMVKKLVAEMAVREGVTEELKAENPVQWTGLMNNLEHAAEEIVQDTLLTGP